jgi:Mpv17 / PMP22 family
MWLPFSFASFMYLDMEWRPLAANLLGLVFVTVLSATSVSDEAVPAGSDTAVLLKRWCNSAAARLQRGRRHTNMQQLPQ